MMEDYEDAGRKLMDSMLAIRRSGGTPMTYNELDAVHEDPKTKAKVYVGNLNCAQNLAMLEKHGITSVVNCQDEKSENYFESRPEFTYYRFFVSFWWREPNMETNAGVLRFFQPLFDFVDGQISQGKSVLIHCLAGAHRAGTTGVGYVMYKKKLSFLSALTLCKSKRPIIDPFGQLQDLCRKLETALEDQRAKEASS